MNNASLNSSAISLNTKDIPHNPLIDAGAIMVCSLIGQDLDESERFTKVTEMWGKLAGGKKVTYDNSVFLEERKNADTNHALAYLMKSKNAFPEKTNIKDVLEFYF